MEIGNKDYLQVVYQYPDGLYKTFLIKTGTIEDFCKSFNLEKDNIISIEHVNYKYVYDKNSPSELSINDLNEKIK